MSEPRGRVRSTGSAADVTPPQSARSGRWVEEVPGMDRDKMLDVALAQIERQYGKGAVMRLGEHPAGQGVSVIPTGSSGLGV